LFAERVRQLLTRHLTQFVIVLADDGYVLITRFCPGRIDVAKEQKLKHRVVVLEELAENIEVNLNFFVAGKIGVFAVVNNIGIDNVKHVLADNLVNAVVAQMFLNVGG